MSSWPIWIAILLLVDAGVGLLNVERFGRVISPRTLRRVAISEAALAIALVVWHFAAR
jgi:hypothetical protein